MITGGYEIYAGYGPGRSSLFCRQICFWRCYFDASFFWRTFL